jgi:hypothetical protein
VPPRKPFHRPKILRSRRLDRLNSLPYLNHRIPRSRGGSARSLSNRLHAIKWPAATGQSIKLHRRVAHAGSSGPIDPAGSPGCRGWRLGKVRADHTSEDAKCGETKPRKANQDCRKSCCGSVFNSFGPSLVAKSKAMLRGGFLFAAGRLYRDRLAGSQETGGSQAGQQKLRIGQNKATGSRRNSSLTPLRQ